MSLFSLVSVCTAATFLFVLQLCSIVIILFTLYSIVFVAYYRAMHFSAKRGIAIACRLSVCPSVCDVGEL